MEISLEQLKELENFMQNHFLEYAYRFSRLQEIESFKWEMIFKIDLDGAIELLYLLTLASLKIPYRTDF